MPKVMGYYRLWVVTEMGYDRVDCRKKQNIQTTLWKHFSRD
jgi:hypothetical protein